jgi:NAD(P)-dependent dehydrogenase (short-subunit alcohol dehydrogenase family)
LDSYGQIDILINNAAMLTRGDLLATDEAMWDLNMNIILKGSFLCSKAALPAMIARKRGVIINISSGNALVAVGSMAYSAAKAGLLNLTKNMAIEYGEHNIRVNAICPGSVRTPIWQPKLDVEPQIFNRIAQRVPLGRVGEPEDIAKAALFLASDDAAWITGDIMAVDGGSTAGRHSRELDPQPATQK